MPAVDAPDGLYVQFPIVKVHNKQVHTTDGMVTVPLDEVTVGEIPGMVVEMPTGEETSDG